MKNVKPLQAGKLNEVVDRLINPLLPEAYSNSNFFVNDIPDHLQVQNDCPVVATVLKELLSTAISNVKNSCVWLSAKLYGNVVLVHVKNSNGFSSEGIQAQLQQLQLLAKKNRGTVGFTSYQSTITSLTFGFYP